MSANSRIRKQQQQRQKNMLLHVPIRSHFVDTFKMDFMNVTTIAIATVLIRILVAGKLQLLDGTRLTFIMYTEGL